MEKAFLLSGHLKFRQQIRPLPWAQGNKQGQGWVKL